MTMYSAAIPLMRVLRGSHQESDAMLVTTAAVAHDGHGGAHDEDGGADDEAAGAPNQDFGLMMRTGGPMLWIE